MAAMERATRKYIKTYISGLDEQIKGGIPAGHQVLVSGTCGTLKSSLAFNIMYHHAKEKKGKGLYISLEQNRTDLIEQMRELGMDIADVEEDLAIVDLGWLRKEMKELKKEAKTSTSEEIDWFEAIRLQIKSYKDYVGYDLLTLDSLPALYALTRMDNPRTQLFYFFEALRDMNFTSLLVSEIQPGSSMFDHYGVESFLCDGIIHLTMERIGGTVGRYISIVKMRTVKHPTDYFPLIVSNMGFEIVTK